MNYVYDEIWVIIYLQERTPTLLLYVTGIKFTEWLTDKHEV